MQEVKEKDNIPIVVILPIVLQPSRESFLAFLGASGLAIGFAFRDFISSIIAGIMVLYETPSDPEIGWK